MKLIHINISGHITTTTINDYRYFIIFTDNYSKFGCVELFVEKSESLDDFKTFKDVAKLKFEKKIKHVNFDKDGEYHKRYDETRRNPGPFTNKIVRLKPITPCLKH